MPRWFRHGLHINSWDLEKTILGIVDKCVLKTIQETLMVLVAQCQEWTLQLPLGANVHVKRFQREMLHDILVKGTGARVKRASL